MIEPGPALSFSALLAQAEGGQLDRDLTRALGDLVAALRAAQQARGGKPGGELTLHMQFRLEDDVVETRHDIRVRQPEAVRARSQWWWTDQGLAADNPAEPRLPFRVAGGEAR